MKSKFNLLITLLSILFFRASAQTPSWEWIKTVGGIHNETTTLTSADASGNVYVTGYFQSDSISFGTTTLHNSGNGTEEIYLAKYDIAGNVVWAKRYGSSTTDASFAITTDNSGNVYVTGSFLGDSITIGSTTLQNTTAGFYDVFIAKWNGNGNEIWAKSFGGTNYDRPYSLAVDGMDNIFLAGTFQSDSINLGFTTLINTMVGYEEIMLLKYDSSGTMIWAKSNGGAAADIPLSITSDDFSNVYMTGIFYSDSLIFGTSTLINASVDTGDIFIVKFDSLGNALWAERAGGIDNDIAGSIARDNVGNIYVAGNFLSNSITFGITTLTNAGAGFYDMFLAKYDSSGNAIWAKQAGGTNGDGANSITIDASCNVYVVGDFYSSTIAFGLDTLTNAGAAGTSDIFFTKYDSSGNSLWAKSMGGTYYDYSTQVASKIGSPVVYVGGYFFSSPISFDSDALSNSDTTATSSDIFLAKLSCETFSSLNATDCDSYSSPSGNYTWTLSGSYIDTISNSVGCDSIIAINLTIINSTSSSDSVTSCFSYISPSGNYTWTTSGIYNDTIPNTIGCDSTITINLTINSVDTSVTQTGVTLFTNATLATYQWLNCDSSFATINGATNQTFTATADGNYAAAITQNGCTDTSSCFAITGVGVNEIDSENDFEIFPNPSDGDVTVQFSDLNKNCRIIISNQLGQELFSENLNQKSQLLNLKSFSQGIYFVKLQTENGNLVVKKIIKE